VNVATTKAKADVKKKPRAKLPVPAAVQGLLSAQQVCDALGGGSVRKLRQMISEGNFPRPDSRFGKYPRWSVAGLNRWVADQVEKDKADPLES
jgi:predicted DNA-binding transcriptional regulator AlpA